MSEPLPPAVEPTPISSISAGSASPEPKRRGFLAVLGNRRFLSIWTGQILSQTAQNTMWYVLIIMVGNLTGRDPRGIGLTIILVQLPTVLFSGVSGVLVDRVSKRMILIGTNVIRVAGVLGYLVFENHVLGLFLITFIVAVVSQPFAPAEGSTLPVLVTEDELITANSLFQMTFMASQAAGFALGPVALGLFGVHITLIVISVLFALASVVLLALPKAAGRSAASAESLTFRILRRRVYQDLAEVTRFIIRDPPLAVALLQIALAPTLLLLLAEVGPHFLSDDLGIGQTSTSLFFLLAPAGAGLAVGMLVLGQWGYRMKKDRLVLVSLIALGATVVALSAVSILANFWQSLAALGIHIPAGVYLTATIVPISALMGIEVAFINAPVQTIVQQRATAELRGRVLAMQQTLTAALAIPPLILVGSVAAIFGTPATLALTGIVVFAVGLAIVYYS